MWWKIGNPQKRWKTPPKELFKEAVHKISWPYVHWITYEVRKSRHLYNKVPVKFVSFLKSKMWRKIANPQKRWKTPPKELFKEAVHKISWPYVHWIKYKVRFSKHLYSKITVKFVSFLKSKMWRKTANPQKRWKTPPKELFKETAYKILWPYFIG